MPLHASYFSDFRTVIRTFLPYYIISCCLKSLLAYGYRSTDFEVHRNWLAITYHVSDPYEWYNIYTNTTSTVPLSSRASLATVSKWTVDYPPLFMYGEYILSHIYSLLLGGGLSLLVGGGAGTTTSTTTVSSSPDLRISAVPVTTLSIILYQRFTVLCGDFILFLGLCSYITSFLSSSSSSSSSMSLLHLSPWKTDTSGGFLSPQTNNPSQLFFRLWNGLTLFILLDPSLWILDHIHFQYNNVLIGFFFILCTTIYNHCSLMSICFVFVCLVLSKHLFLYLSPIMGIYILYRCCYKNDVTVSKENGRTTNKNSNHQNQNNHRNSLWLTSSFLPLPNILGNILQSLGICIGLGLGILVPVLYTHPFQGIVSIVTRLFPFGRGLVHDYWAPNLWAFYMILDRIMMQLCTRFTVIIHRFSGNSVCSLTNVPNSTPYNPNHLSVLPTPTPLICAFSVIICTLPLGIYYLWSMHDRYDKSVISKNGKSTTFTSGNVISQYFINILIFGWFTSFLLGYHVHEKAAIYGLLPLYLTIPSYVMFGSSKVNDKVASKVVKPSVAPTTNVITIYPYSLRKYIQYCKYLSLAIYVSFLPLIMIPIKEPGTNWTGLERPFLVTLGLVYYYGIYIFWQEEFTLFKPKNNDDENNNSWYDRCEFYFVYGSLFLCVICQWNILWFMSLPFLPLLLTSLVTGIIILYTLGGIFIHTRQLWNNI